MINEKTQPILTILVRHMVNKRKTVVKRMIESIEAMVWKYDIQLLMVDDFEESGHPHVSQLVIESVPQINGAYVWLLDDDDVCTCPQLPQLVKRIASRHNPDMILCRSLIDGRGMMPLEKEWGKPVSHYQPATIPMPSMIIKADIWKKAIPAIAGKPKRIDWFLFDAVSKLNPKIYYLDYLVAWQPTKNSTRGESVISEDAKAIMYVF